MIRSVSYGTQKVNFKHAFTRTGRIIIAGAELLEDDKSSRPAYALRYEYDDDGRLSRVTAASTERADKQMREERKLVAGQTERLAAR